MVLNVAVLHGRGVVPLIDANQPLLLDRLFIVALTARGVLQDVVGVFLMELRRTVLHCLLHVEDKGQLLIFDLDQCGSLRRCNLVLRHDGSDIVAVITDMAVEQAAVGDVLMRLLDRPRMARGRELNVRNVKTGKDLYYAGDFFGCCDVNRLHIAVRDGGAYHTGDKRMAVAQIIRVFGSAGSLVERVYTGYTLANIHIM